MYSKYKAYLIPSVTQSGKWFCKTKLRLFLVLETLTNISSGPQGKIDSAIKV